jgi:hypothetical protein
VDGSVAPAAVRSGRFAPCAHGRAPGANSNALIQHSRVDVPLGARYALHCAVQRELASGVQGPRGQFMVTRIVSASNPLPAAPASPSAGGQKLSSHQQHRAANGASDALGFQTGAPGHLLSLRVSAPQPTACAAPDRPQRPRAQARLAPFQATTETREQRRSSRASRAC